MIVEVVEYNPQWAKQFEEIKKELQDVLSGVRYVGIEHVGSTSIPGMAAKPVIDIDIVTKAADVQSAITALTSSGKYDYLGERGVPDRHAFRYPASTHDRNVYVVLDNCLSYQNHVGVRDICRKDPEVLEAYKSTKLELAKKEWVSVDDYAQAKSDILFYVLGKAGLSENDRKVIRARNLDIHKQPGWFVSGHNP